MKNADVVIVLKKLIRTCRDGQEGFHTAAEKIRNSEFRRLFNIFSQQRAQFVAELEAEIHRIGGSIEGPMGVAKPSTASNVRPSVLSEDEGSIISDCQRLEEVAVRSYQEALYNDLPLDVQYVAKRQYMDIKDAYDRIRILQRAA